MRSFLLFSLLVLSLAVCAQPQQPPVSITEPAFGQYYAQHKPPVVSGKILHASEKELSDLTITYSLVTPFSQFQSKRSTTIHKDGSFRFELDYPFPYQQLWFSMGEALYTCVMVNTDVTILIDLPKVTKAKEVTFAGDGLSFAGTDGAINTWHNQYIVYNQQFDDLTGSKVYALKRDKATYFQQLDSMFSLQKLVNDSFCRMHPSPYAWLLENERLSNYYGHVLRFAAMSKTQAPHWEAIKKHPLYCIDNDGMQFKTALLWYGQYVTGNKNDSLRSLIGHSFADAVLLSTGTTDLHIQQELTASLLKNVTTPWVQRVLEKEYAATTKSLAGIKNMLAQSTVNNTDTSYGTAVEKLAFGATLTRVKNLDAATFMQKLSQQFKGKAIIIDLWATWCSPCLNDMPHSRKLHDEAHQLPVEFVYVCTASGSSEEKWKNKVVELKQPGTHFFIDDKLAGELMNMFHKSGYPSYICLDRSGQLSAESISFMHNVSLAQIEKIAQ